MCGKVGCNRHRPGEKRKPFLNVRNSLLCCSGAGLVSGSRREEREEGWMIHRRREWWGWEGRGRRMG